jgi:colanic acid/amylovoran biosynthesis glycosyltransferase
MEGGGIMVNNTVGNKMKILYLLDTFPNISSEAFIANEIIELTKLGHNIKILAHYREKGKIHNNITEYNLLQNTVHNKEYSGGIEKTLDFVAKASFDLIKSPLNTTKLLFCAIKTHKNIWHLLDSYLGARQILSSEFDLIYAPFPLLNHLSQAFYLSKIFKKSFIVTFRALDIYKKNKKRELEYRTKLIKEASKIITISAYNKTNIINKFGIRDEVEIIRDSTNVDVFRPTGAKQRRKIISICRFIEKKGIKYLIEACNILKNKGVDFECLLIGSGPLRADYERLIEKYGLEKYISIKGPLTQEKIKQELSDSMIFVLPCVIAEDGDRDILPNVLKEAMAMEIPVITSDICGIEELIENGKNGILLPPKNPQAIEEAMEKLFGNEELRERLGKAGREKIRKDFNVQIEARKLERVFKEAAG